MLKKTLVVCAMVAPAALSGQQTRLDPIGGDYFIIVYNDDNEPVERRLVPADKVEVNILVAVSDSGPNLAYSYRVEVLSSSPQGLEDFRLSCPTDGVEALDAVGTDSSGTHRWRSDHDDYGAVGVVCYFSGGAAAIATGGIVTAALRSPRLPSIGLAFLTGSGAGIVGGIPSSDVGVEGNRAAREFEMSVSGITGGWKEITSIVPTRDPALFADPARGLSLIQGDLTESCGTLAWINSTEACAQLASELAESATAVTAAAWREARSSLSDFLTTLEAQHDSAGPRTVHGNAFALLATNARFVFDRLPNPPTAAAGGPYAAVEGSSVTLDGTGSLDPGGATLTFAWDFGDGQAGSGASPTHTYADDGTYQAELVATSSTSALADTAAATVVVGNAAPIVTSLSGPLDPVSVGTSVTVTADFTDVGVQDTHSANVAWGDGATSAAGVSQGPGSGSIEASHAYGQAGVYTIVIDLTDDDGGSTEALHQFAVVYDASAGFVTGGGWIDSPVGAYAPDPSATGKANFGFVSRYQQGAEVPEGETQFRMHTADLAFHSDSYQWLVVAGARAQFKGTGVLNGASGYGFMLTAIDGEEAGGGGADRFRIKIWRLDTEDVVYDNQRGDGDDAAVATGLGGGRITIHRE